MEGSYMDTAHHDGGPLGSLAGRRLDRDFGVADEAELAPQLLFDGGADVDVLLEERLDVLAALAQPFAAIGEPRAALLDDLTLDGEVEQVGLAERRGELVLHHLDAGAAADHRVAVLDRGDAADVDAHRGIELERPAAGGGFGVAEHH